MAISLTDYFSQKINYQIFGGTSIITVLVSALLLRVSLPLFVLWVGVIGAVVTWCLLSWTVGSMLKLQRRYLQNGELEVKVAADEDGITSGGAKGSTDGNECLTCGIAGCQRHLKITGIEALQPWLNLTAPKKVDNALEDLLTHVLDRFIYDWYRNLCDEEATIDELRTSLRFLVAKLLLRLKRVDLAEFITARIIPAVVTHLVQHVHSHRKVGRYNADMIRLRRTRVHRSLYKRDDELAYLKHLTSSLFPYIIPKNVQQCRSLRLLLEQILSGVVLLPVADKLADPDFINNLLIIFADDKPPPVNPDPPSEPVEILAHFSVPNSNSQPFHCHDLGRILSDQDLLMCFMDVMKRNGSLKFLQFFITLEDFKHDLLSSTLDEASLKKLSDEASHIYRVFCRPEASDYIDIGADLLTQFKLLADNGDEGIKDLRAHGDFLARAYDYLYYLMDSYYLPLFRHSSQYFTYMYGEKNARSQATSRVKTDRRGFSMSSKLRASLKSDKPGLSLSGSSGNLKDMDTLSTASTPDRLSLQDEDIVDESVLEELHDISGWIVEIPSISIQLDPNHRGKTLYSFQVKVYRDDPHNAIGEPGIGSRIRTGTSVYRTHSDFYSLEQKLKQFHGEKLTTQLPPKKLFGNKDHEYLDGVKPGFEAFLKNVLIMSDLKNSELLYNFLTVEDFSKSSISEIRIESVLKSVPGRLIKEKGQNLKHFLKSFQSSTVQKAPRPDFSKMTSIYVEKHDRPSSLILRHLRNPLYEKSHIRQPSNGVAVEPNNHLLTVSSHSLDQASANSLKLTSVVDCLVHVAEEVFAIPKTIHWIICTITLVGKKWIDYLITWYIGNKMVQLLEEHRVEALIHLLRDNLFYGDGTVRTREQAAHRKIQALNDIKNVIPAALGKVLDKELFETCLEEIFEVLQHPKLNKQLVYILLDTIVYELFPELKVDPHPSDQP